MRNVLKPSCTENQNTHFVFNNFFPENGAVYEIVWKNIVGRGRAQMTIWRMCIACCIPKATNTHSQYVILIAFPLQQWLYERASVIRTLFVLLFTTFLSSPTFSGTRLGRKASAVCVCVCVCVLILLNKSTLTAFGWDITVVLIGSQVSINAVKHNY